MEKLNLYVQLDETENGANCMKNSMVFLKQFKIKLSDDAAIPLLGIYPKYFKRRTARDIYSPTHIVALFTKVCKRWKLPKRPRIDEWVQKM